MVEGFFPTGDQTIYQGDDCYQGDDWRIAPTLVIEGITDTEHRVSLNVGFTHRQEPESGGLSVGSTFDWGFAATFVTEYVHVVPELRGSLVMTASDIGFGETRPIASNRSRAGRASNRRVELRILQQEGCQDTDAAEAAVP